MNRRRFLRTIAASGAVVFSGCATNSPGRNSATTRATSASTASTSSPVVRSPSSTTTASPTPTSADNRTGTPAPDLTETLDATVTEVTDGDTMDVTFGDGSEDTLRLLGVDTPETYTENDPSEYDLPDTAGASASLDRWGERASTFATDRLGGARIAVGIDAEADRRGSYDRLLCYVFRNESNFNAALLDRGFARVYDSAFSLREAFDRAENRAMANGTGLWGYEAAE